MNVVQPRVSFADLERAPEDGRRYELYDGEVSRLIRRRHSGARLFPRVLRTSQAERNLQDEAPFVRWPVSSALRTGWFASACPTGGVTPPEAPHPLNCYDFPDYVKSFGWIDGSDADVARGKLPDHCRGSRVSVQVEIVIA